MPTYTSNFGWTKPSGSDNVDISVLNNNLDNQDSTIHDAFLNMAPLFSELSTYAVDDIVLYSTTTYKCHTAVVTPGSWTGSTNWQVYKLSEGGGGGLALGETSSTAYRGDRGKTAYDHSQTTGNPHNTTKSDVGLGNVPNVSTNDQTPTFTEASTRNNIASGEKLSVILGKIQKFFNDLKTIAFSGSYTDLSNKPTIPTTASGITYDNTDSGLTATDVQGAVDELTSGLTNLGSATDLGNVHGSDTITLSDAVSNYRFIQIRIGYYGSGYPCFGQALLPVSTLLITADDISTTVAFSDRNGTTSGKADISFLSATSVKVVNSSSVVYTKIVGIA